MLTDHDAPVGAPPPSADVAGRHRYRYRGVTLAIAACAAAALPLSACGSGGGSSATATVTAKTCQQVSAVLSDGPDPGEDPVGYAEAQILPLRQVHTSDAELRTAIASLADAYARFFASDGKSTAAISSVTAAAAHMNKLCPGAGATA
ncbi:MAG TPA: hypothetical protein VEL03_12920 [Streptosporangiaceae bacterium]|nr:hypothetical protein [Streptosporangiaceae bacterium]